jgi:hypothetical protein
MMNPSEPQSVGTEEPRVTSSEGMSRRRFVERLRRAALFVAPVVATVALTNPKAMAIPTV